MDEAPLPASVSNVASETATVPISPEPPSTSYISPSPVPMICPRCHFPVKPEYYFCPNCGAKLTEVPLSTSVTDQLLLYAFSIILPWIAYLAITKWQGINYLRSPDSRAKQVGLIALILLVASSVLAFWLTTIWIQNYVQQSMSDLNTNFGGI